MKKRYRLTADLTFEAKNLQEAYGILATHFTVRETEEAMNLDMDDTDLNNANQQGHMLLAPAE